MFNYYNINRETGQNLYDQYKWKYPTESHAIKPSYNDYWCKITDRGIIAYLDIEKAKNLGYKDVYATIAIAAYNLGKYHAMQEVKLAISKLEG